MSQTFLPPTLRFVGCDVSTACSSAPVPGAAIWGRAGEGPVGGGRPDPRKYQPAQRELNISARDLFTL